MGDRLLDRLPAGAHLHAGDHDALVLLIPETNGVAVASWMHHALTGVLDDVTVEGDLVGLQLRSVVTGPDGPVGAQLLQHLDHARYERIGSGPGALPDPAGAGAVEHARAGRHDATGRLPYEYSGRGQAGEGQDGRRRRAEPDAPVPDEVSALPDIDFTEGMGLADLLAGALAAYRRI